MIFIAGGEGLLWFCSAGSVSVSPSEGGLALCSSRIQGGRDAAAGWTGSSVVCGALWGGSKRSGGRGLGAAVSWFLISRGCLFFGTVFT